MKKYKFRSPVVRIVRATPFRLFAVYVSLFCGAVAVTFIYVYLQLQGFLEQDAQTAVQADFQLFERQYSVGGAGQLVRSVSERSVLTGRQLLLITDSGGNRLAGNIGTVSAGLWNAVGAVHFAYRGVDDRDRSARQALGVVARFADGTRLIAARDVEDQESVKRVMRRAFSFGYAVIAAIGLAGAVLISRHLLERVDAASETARSIMQGNLADRIPITGRADELDRLGQNLNAMLDRIQDLMTGLKDVSDNIAHDLKTPLHRLRTRAERSIQTGGTPQQLRQALAAVIEDADGLIHTFDALLNIARLEAGSRSETFGQLDICELVRDVAELYEPLCEQSGLNLTVMCNSDVTLAGEKHLLGQAVANLLDNAIKYAGHNHSPDKTGNAGVSGIEIRLTETLGFVDIVVADRGPGIAAADRERVFHRFVRLQLSRSIPGSGLGLSLVAAVARLHGGSVHLEDNDPGLRVRLRLMKNMADSMASLPARATALRYAV